MELAYWLFLTLVNVIWFWLAFFRESMFEALLALGFVALCSYFMMTTKKSKTR